MPIYEYECTECGHIREVQRSVEDRRTPGVCNKCESAGITILVPSVSSFVMDPAVSVKPRKSIGG